MQMEKGDSKKRRNDIIFILALATVCVVVGLAIFFLRGEGDYVTVTVDGKVYGSYSLSDDVTVEIINLGGVCTNLLIIKDGSAYVEYADCPDGICVSHRAISRDKESIVCLPNRVVITVHKNKTVNEPDIIA